MLFRSPGAKAWEDVFYHPQQRDDSYIAQWNHLVNCIEYRETPLVSGEDGLRVLEIIEAARNSAAVGKSVAIETAGKIDGSDR